MRVIFLDIDGVLMSGRAWCLPQNVHARQLLLSDMVLDAVSCMTFDPCAVALVNRLSERSRAKIVLHSNWRQTVGHDETHRKLLAEGIEARHFHVDHSCPFRFAADKVHDIRAWLTEHRANPVPEWPGDGPQLRGKRRATTHAKRAREYERQLSNYGIDYIVVDDECLDVNMSAQLKIDQFEGFSVADYRASGGFFGIEDHELGLFRVSEEDFRRVERVVKPRIAAVDWLHRPLQSGVTRAARLNIGRLRQQIQQMKLRRSLEEEEALIVERREMVWRELHHAR
jgi:HAD domain in Swiss Army Knife RNA repair proteins